ncbi:LptF/LptG family permease [Aureimonas leprariae]|uniref:YjgP/YjgQ family permease n=1 Tax=Plantimonas leprariae TaxID=2615207 RepID=A0A7V7PLL7_9HYPH|nr:LptF/LptG family permease [Aureimonas leprariae]KAB0677193.1 YjgP/YjgQ family permease [Aureimonas leprariae]
MITLASYLSSRLLLTALGTVAVLGALVQILDLLDTTEDILAMGEGASGFLFYVAMRTPSILPEVLPLGVLLATLFVLAPLVRHGEIVAMRAAGMHVGRIFLAMLPALVVIALGHYAIADGMRPPAERRLAEWWAENGVKTNKPVWLKIDGRIVEAGRVLDGGRRLENVRIFDRDLLDAVSTRTVAGAARYAEGRWTLDDATVTDLRRQEIGTGRPADGVWNTRLRPRDVIEAMAPDANVSVGAAYDVLVGRRLAVAAPSVYATALQRAFAEPASDFVMLLLALPLAFASWRDGRSGRVFILSLGAGLVFLLTDGVVATLGRAGVIQPALAAWSPSVGFAILAFLLLRRLEGVRHPRGGTA